MIGIRLGFLVVVLVVCSLAPGFFFVRKLRWGPLEKLCGAVALSLIIIYLASLVIYLLNLPVWVHWCVTGLSVLAGAVCMGDLARMLRARQVRRPLIAFALLVIWSVLALGLVRNYSGGGWGGDWYEHYQRTELFLKHLPADTVIYGGYLLPARPPMMNLLAAHWLANGQNEQFASYQLVFVFLNLLVFLPCCLLTRALIRRGGRGVLVLAALFALNPMFMQNVTYTWTKLLAGFYVVLAIWLYLAGWRKGDGVRTVSAFICLAAGTLVHYSTGPYVVFIALHFGVLLVLRPRQRWRAALAGVVLSTALLGTWLAWSVATYGAGETFASNTAVTAAQKASGGNLAKIASNIFDTIVPHPLRSVSLDLIRQPNKLGYWRDYAFLIYQTSFILAMGVVGGVAVLCVMVWSMLARSLRASGRQKAFWLALVVSCTVMGIAVVGERERFGVAHICLPPLVFIGLSLLAGAFGRLPRPARLLVALGCAVDFAVGIFLHFSLENMTFRIWRQGGRLVAMSPDGKILSNFALGNWLLKQKMKIAFFGDLVAGYSTLIRVVIVGIFLLIMAAFIREALAGARPAAVGGRAFGRSPRSTSGGSGPARSSARSGSVRRRGPASGRAPARRARRRNVP